MDPAPIGLIMGRRAAIHTSHSAMPDAPVVEGRIRRSDRRRAQQLADQAVARATARSGATRVATARTSEDGGAPLVATVRQVPDRRVPVRQVPDRQARDRRPPARQALRRGTAAALHRLADLVAPDLGASRGHATR